MCCHLHSASHHVSVTICLPHHIDGGDHFCCFPSSCVARCCECECVCVSVCMSLCALFYVYLYPSNYKSLTFLRHCPEIRFIFQIYLNKIEKKNTKRFRWFAERYVSGGILKRQAHATISVETCWKAVSAFILSLAWCKAV